MLMKMNSLLKLFLVYLVILTIRTKNKHVSCYERPRFVTKNYCTFDNSPIDNSTELLKTFTESDYIFTGKINSEIDVNDEKLNFNVSVKRLLKGNYLTNSFRVLYVNGDRNCTPRLRVGDSAIFLGVEQRRAHVRLILQPVPLTVHNLNRMNAAGKELNYQPRPIILKAEPCAKTYCAWGAICIVGADGRAHCQCPASCDQPDPTTDTSVCGSDGITYPTRCHLRRTSCLRRLNMRVRHTGQCNITDTELADPCRGVTCGPGARCVASADGRNAHCACPQSCPSYGDHAASRPVCGSDARDYRDRCELRRRACETNTNITVKFEGKCDPCSETTCPEPEVCQLDVQRNPVCRCGDACPLEFTPVCGSDGKTYSNECALRQEACRTRRPLRIVHRGKCSSAVNPCSSTRCSSWEECTINKYGIARCECPTDCEPVMRPVCSKDGRTFTSECELRKTACNTRTTIDIAYSGVCDKAGPCSEHQCKWGAQCVEHGLVAQCECPSCPTEFQPVCGSDGISYSNECKLRLEACNHQRDISVLYDGPCNGCENKKCDFYSTCESDGLSEAQCVCPKTCDNNKDNSPVCGTDGVTYDSECHLKVASCETKQYVIVAYHGHCDLCKDIECKFGAHCKAGECVCPKDCTDSGIEAVCASNMVTFTNECELKKASCLLPENSQPLNVIFYGDCRERFAVVPDPIALRMEVKPCNGEKPLVDPVTQKELDCGSGVNRQDCPSDSYCHQTTRFARCCQKSQKVSPKSCEDSWFGCCPDGKTPAQGVDHAGCPSQCSCHRLGSFDDTCDPETGQCHCRPGVGGLKCDRCEPGYWGLPKISSGHHGCLPCGCSSFGSVRDDCEQMTGRCVCKPEIQGQKCTVCTSHDKVLGPNGCVAVDRTTPPPSTCKELNCHFGAICTERRGLAICECHSECGNETPGSQQVVCGSDGQTYESECQLRLLACRHQKDIVVYAFGPCKGTDWPIGRYTPMQFTQPDEQHSPLSKSTRHLLTPDSRYYYSRYSPSTGNWENSGFKETDLITGISFNAHAAYRPTPATVRVLTALLGDICSEDTDCLIQNSICIGSACTCRQGFVESLDRQECLAHSIPMTTTEESRACISSPCFGDSTCIDLPSATFTCVCGTNFTGPQCEHEVNLKAYEIPSFDGTSYIKLKTIKAYHKLNMEIELKTYDDDGIIFYNQQKTDGSGDFISLAIINGYIEFRYNLGNGVVKIVSLKKIEKFKYHRIIIKRYHRDGILKIDDGDDVAGHSPGKLRALDLKDDAFIGYITLNVSKIYENIGTANGFNGCIRKLKINHRLIEMQPGSDELVIDTHRIQECGENPCAHLRCLNGATCHSHGTESYHCVCTEDFTGKYCESRLDQCTSSPCKHGSTCESLPNGKYYCKCLPGRIGPKCEEIVFNHNTMIIPEFNGSSFIEYPKLEGVGKEFSVEIWFLSFSANGLILYSGQHKKGTGDFVAVNLVNKHLQFRFNLGSGICNITSKETIELFKWHQVKINRYEREGTLQVNNGSVVRGFSGPSLIELNLELPLYIGSIPMWNQIHRLSGATKGFRGAIQRIILNGKEIPILHTKACLTGHILSKNDCKSHHVSKYTGFPCSSMKNPCLNGGTCVPILNDYICKCVSDDYEGAQCENALHTKKAVKFSGKTFLQYRNKKNSHFINNSSSGFLITDNEEEMYDEEKDDYETDDGIILDYDLDEYSDSEILGRKGERVNKYQIRFRTLDSEGLILWRSKNRSLYRHYLAIAIVDGYPEFSYNLGKQNDFWSIRYPKKINDGAWHTIVARRQKRTGHISIDGDKAEKGISWPGAVLFNGSPRIWIGGSPGLPAGLPISYYTGFRGCIQYVKINNKPLDLWKDRASVLQYCHENQV